MQTYLNKQTKAFRGTNWQERLKRCQSPAPYKGKIELEGQSYTLRAWAVSNKWGKENIFLKAEKDEK